jgi:amino acid adenylation domain-containing protein/FkbM family methyltransferase
MDLIVGLLGILKAGAGYVPLDPSYPKERLAFMLEDAKVAALVIRRSVEDALPEHHLPVLRLDADENSLAAESTEEPSTGVGPDNLAYVIYTSGSTGKPKGVMITHANASRLFEATYERFRFDETDVWTLFHSFAFDFSVWEIWGALLYGGRLVVVPFWISRSPIAFLDLLAAERVTVLNQTPSAFQQLMAADEEAGGTARLALRLVIFGGEALDLGSLKPWFERRSDQRPQLANMYGITETTVHVTYRSLTAQDAEGGRGSCIGRPIPDLQLYLLDTRLEPVPIGVSGEIYVGGAGVARGYLGRPDLTADKFVPDPFSAEPGARLYRSGDLARRLGDGDVEYLGRIDDQLKIRGFRIETGEIESTLGQHPAVRQSVVRAYAPAPGDTRLAAYVVPDPQHAFPLRQMLRLEAEGRLEGRTLYELPNGMAVAYLNRSETDFLYKEIFEGNAYLRHGIRLRPGDCVFDVGANIGVSVLFFASRHPEVTVYAFEPLRPIFEVLALNLELYGVSGRAFPFGLSSERGTAEFTYYPYASVISGQFADVAAEQDTVKTFLLNEQRLGGGANGIAETAFDELLSVRLTTEIQTCELRTLSEILREHPVKTIDLLKVDVEKGEEAVLQGILDEDWPLIRQVAIEVHDIDGRLDRVKRLLQGKGFKLAVHQDTSFRGTALFNLYGVRRSQAESPAVAAPEAESAVLPAPGWSSRKALAGELRAFLQKVLPDHMIPSMFTFLESMPLTVNGKINYQSLPAPSVVGSDRDGFKEALQTRTEEVLARIWAEILAVERVGRQDNFFELGGHSLLATQLVARMTKAFDIEFPLRAVFEYPTLAALSDHVDMVRWVADSSSGAVLAMGPQEEGEL